MLWRLTGARMQEQWGTPRGSKTATVLATGWSARYLVEWWEGTPSLQLNTCESHEKGLPPDPILKRMTTAVPSSLLVPYGAGGDAPVPGSSTSKWGCDSPEGRCHAVLYSRFLEWDLEIR